MRTLTTILAVVLLMAAVAQANVLFDIGRHNLSVNPETDGKYWNNMPYANSTDPGVFMPVRDKWVSGTGWVNVGPCVDDAGNPSGVTMRSRDIPSNFATSTTLAPYPNNVIADAWNGQGGSHATSAAVRLEGLGDAVSYDIDIVAYYPSDPWVVGGGIYTCQGTSYTYDNSAGSTVPAVYSFTNLSPVNGRITITMDKYLPPNETRQSQMGLLLIDLVPEPATLSLLALGGLAVIRRRR